MKKCWEKEKKRKTSNIRFILEGRILLLTHHAASVAMVTTGNNFCLLSPSLYPLNCVYLYFYSLHLGLGHYGHQEGMPLYTWMELTFSKTACFVYFSNTPKDLKVFLSAFQVHLI